MGVGLEGQSVRHLQDCGGSGQCLWVLFYAVTRVVVSKLYGVLACGVPAQEWKSKDFKANFWDLSGQIVYRAMQSFSFGRFP